jgi:hypothetical protein
MNRCEKYHHPDLVKHTDAGKFRHGMFLLGVIVENLTRRHLPWCEGDVAIEVEVGAKGSNPFTIPSHTFSAVL